MEKAEQEKAVKEKLNFLIDLAIIVMVAVDRTATKEELKIFNKAKNHCVIESQ